jgi:hypothetical protein
VYEHMYCTHKSAICSVFYESVFGNSEIYGKRQLEISLSI